MKRINIFGSSVSRDIFRFDRKNEYEVPVYIARSSLLSNLQMNSWEIEDDQLLLDSKIQKETVIRDLNKHVYADVASGEPDYLMIDFIDERFRIAKLNDKYATYSNELVNSQLLEGRGFELLDKVPKTVGWGYTFEGKDIEPYIKSFAHELKSRYKEEQIIIHEAYMRDTYISKDGKLKKFPQHICNDVKQKNRMLRYMYKMLYDYIPGANVMNLFNEREFLINEKHLWGLTPMHYEDDYYYEALNRLNEILSEGGDKQIHKRELDEFSADDVEIKLAGNMITAINHFKPLKRKTQYSWYVNTIKENKIENVFKSSSWSEDNTFKYRAEEIDTSYLLIAYVKFADDNKRVNRIAGRIERSPNSHEWIVQGLAIDDLDRKHVSFITDTISMKVDVTFDAYAPLQYAWYIFENDYRHLIYKSKGFSPEPTFSFIPSDAESTYYFQIYARDISGFKKIIKTKGVRVGFSEKGMFGMTINQFNCDMALPEDKTNLMWADEIVKGNLYIHKSFQSAPNIRDGLDWNIVFSQSPGTYQLRLQSLGMIGILVRAYQLKNSLPYLKTANEFLLSWIEYEESSCSNENTIVWHDHGSALRVNTIIYFALTAEEAGIMDEATAEFIRGLVRKHSEFLADEVNYTQNHNHGIFQDQSLLYCAYFLNDRTLADLAKKRLCRQIEFAFNEEKVHVENSSAYHIALLYMLDDIAGILENMKDYFSSYVRANIKASADFCAYLCRPSGNLINTGDSSIDNNRRKYDIRAKKLGSESYLFSATQGKEGKQPERASIMYPKSGYYFYKQDHNLCTRFTDATWKMFKSGYSSRTHKHADDLSFAMYSRGYDIFSDTGYYNYNSGNAYCDYFKSAKAHNTVIVDGDSYSTENESAYKVGIYDYELTDQYDHIIGYNDMYEGVSIDRHFYSLHDVTVLYDNIMAKGTHTYTQIFHLSEHMKIVDKSNRQVLMQIKDTEYMVRIKQYGKQKCMLEEIRGEENEDMADREIQGGYLSYAQNEVTAATTLHFSISGDNVDFITVITVEDKEGKSIYHNPHDKYIEKISYDKFVYNEESNRLLFGENKIKLDARKRKNLDAVAVKISERQIMIHDMERSIDEGCEYEYELIRADTGLIFYKKVYSNNDKCISELPENDVLVKGKLRRNGKEICKKMIAYIKYDSKLKEHYLDTSNYPFLNLIYKGQHIEKIEEEGYTFIVDIEYSLNYKIKWYVYRNGVYEFVTLTENLNTFTYYFKKAGSYTVSYYIMTGSGENQMYSFKRIMIKEH
ncbi:DUF6270 domain-containing protein [Hominibacterium faecale]|uniref:DUF6270 domain-containing protein n=1 Tax=Hominibacterium faecale TaxID=2839743 RepID=UPI0022B2A98B|nr:DUF6270 domain-containing protein [Hominibacterium faecale]